MKKFIVKIMLFLGFAGVFYIVMILFYGAFVPPFFSRNFRNFTNISFTEKRLQEADRTKNIDVLVIGSSHASKGYDPRIFSKAGYSLFNLGTNGQSPMQTTDLLNKYVNAFKPKLVIVDVYPLLLSGDGIESSIDLVSSGFLDGYIIKKAFRQNNIKLYNTIIYSFLDKNLHITKHKSTAGQRSTYIHGGYEESFEVLKKDHERPKSMIHLESKQLQAFKEIIATLKSKNIRYVIVQAPFSKLNYDSYTNNGQIDQWLSTEGTYFNFNKLINLPEKMFLDDSHLNQLGVTAYNDCLLNILRKKKVLPAPHEI